jgi:hypothetical protein
MDRFLDLMTVLFIPIIVIGGVAYFLFKAPRNGKIIGYLRNQKVLFGFLLLWTLLGFFTQQDFTERCDCLIHSRGIFSLDYIVFSVISIILISIGFFVKNKFARVALLSLELAYWIFKLFILKSGYVGGLGIMIFKYYDFIGLLLRFLILNSLFGYKIKEYGFVLLAGLIIAIKMLGIPCNDNFIYDDFLNPYYNQLMFEDINGNWTGFMLYPRGSIIDSTFKNPGNIIYGSKPEITTYRDTVIFSRFENSYFYFNDSNLRIDNSAPELNGDYLLTYSSPESGYLNYLPLKYVEAAKEDYRFIQYSMRLLIKNVSDSILSCQIDGRIDLELKTTHNNGYSK